MLTLREKPRKSWEVEHPADLEIGDLFWGTVGSHDRSPSLFMRHWATGDEYRIINLLNSHNSYVGTTKNSGLSIRGSIVHASIEIDTPA